MKNKFIAFIILCALICAGCTFFIYTGSESHSKLDAAKVNDIAKTYEESNDCSKAFFAAKQYGLSVSILDENEKLIDKVGNASDNIFTAISDREAVITLEDNKGYVIVSDNFSDIYKEYRAKTTVIFLICTGLFIIMMVLFSLYIYYRIVKPFEKLRIFAARVAQGNLDCPLEMDRENIFGAFTESFDLMRVELANAKDRERQANQSKKELIASLSHDIKTPVASIRATAELLDVMSDNPNVRQKLSGIEQKADQIELLINNLFNATLEELQALEVRCADENSAIVSELIRLADYSELVEEFTVPECIISCDKLRLGQVFDNIISNSYKYAATPISVNCQICDSYLFVDISDKGKGLSDDEAARCCEKFFRGENSSGKNGSGLGLYISSYFCEKMGGGLEIRSTQGFTVRVICPLS